MQPLESIRFKKTKTKKRIDPKHLYGSVSLSFRKCNNSNANHLIYISVKPKMCSICLFIHTLWFCWLYFY